VSYCGGCGGGYCGGGYCCGGGCYSGGYSCGGCYGGGAIYSSVGVVGGSYASTTTTQPIYASSQPVTTTQSAQLIVNVPADAKLIIDGRETKSSTTVRRFQSPPLQSGYTYNYTLEAEMMKDGQRVTAREIVTVRPGQQTQVTLKFDETASTVASK